MKRTLGILTTVAVLAAASVQTQAGGREWATTGKVLTGVAGGLLLARALEPAPVVYESAPVYYQAPVVVQQAPVVQQASVVAPAPVYQTQPTVVYQQAPVVYAPAPVVVVRPAPYYYAPGPVVSFGFGFGGGHYYHGGYHRRW